MNNEKVSLNEMIEKIIDSDALVIVEGKKDSAALRKLGIANIIELSKKPIYGIVEEIAGKTNDCIILTDLDRKGKELFGKLNEGLQRHGVRVDNTFREFLFRHTKLRQIEGITQELRVF